MQPHQSHTCKQIYTSCLIPCVNSPDGGVCGVQASTRQTGPEVQTALAAKQQAQQAEDIARLQEQLDASQKALDHQKAAAQKLEQVICSNNNDKL